MATTVDLGNVIGPTGPTGEVPDISNYVKAVNTEKSIYTLYQGDKSIDSIHLDTRLDVQSSDSNSCSIEPSGIYLTEASANNSTLLGIGSLSLSSSFGSLHVSSDSIYMQETNTTDTMNIYKSSISYVENDITYNFIDDKYIRKSCSGKINTSLENCSFTYYIISNIFLYIPDQQIIVGEGSQLSEDLKANTIYTFKGEDIPHSINGPDYKFPIDFKVEQYPTTDIMSIYIYHGQFTIEIKDRNVPTGTNIDIKSKFYPRMKTIVA